MAIQAIGTTTALIMPQKGEKFDEIEKRIDTNQILARIDHNGDGKFNNGKEKGDTVKIFDFNSGRATGAHLVKKGELGMSTPAGQVEHTEVPLGRSLKKTFAGKTEEQIQKVVPGAILANPRYENIFDQGSTLMLKSKDGTRYNIHYIKDGEYPAKIAKRTGAKSVDDIKSDKGIMVNEMVWFTIPQKTK